ncbi:alpha-N-acetylglucosaminidase-like [Corticium candelabrum]|uniref:alpha-N-acetylglucosaminidase-like n=1 Tax=Corticium candelabrum TaxID=121492 RepID=UPI002E2774D9|nr:alpha-N-acetylglucosaminidase-like [Corticium candelabrum]
MFTQLQLQHLILTRMRSFGMMLVLPGFAGHVPSSITRLYPNASVHQTITNGHTWGHFSRPYCCTYLLDPADSLFREITHVYMSELIQEFGTDHFYSVDLFNELSPKSSDTEYLHDLSAGVFTAMSYVDPATVWYDIV